jgi:hypothetical protein
MPKMEIDYSNTIIYKITCKDPLVTDLYVGHTTNFVQRKHGHKQGCKNEKSSNYNCKLYKAIRANGGWDNWVMEIVAFFKCNDHYEARIKEQEYFTSLNATLNSLEPLPKPKPKPIETPELVKTTYFCDTCNVTLQNNYLLEAHNQSKKHNTKIGIETNNAKFYCELCDYGTYRKSNYDSHIMSSRHSKNNLSTTQNTAIKQIASKIYMCQNCTKSFNDRAGLWRHNKKCATEIHPHTNDVLTEITPTSEIQELKEFMKYLMKENSDMKNMMMEIIKNGTYNTTTNNTNSQ